MDFSLFTQKTHRTAVISKKLQRLKVAVQVMILGVLASQPAHALSNQFPQYPLITGGGTRVLPNVLLILDDSGSMRSAGIPENLVGWSVVTLPDTPMKRSYIYNELYYNPARTYKPWRTSSTDPNARLPNADYKNVSYSTIHLTGQTINLGGHTESYFFIPKSGISNPGNNRSNYHKYRISPHGTMQVCNDYWNDCHRYDKRKKWVDSLPDNNYDNNLKRRRTNAEEVQNFANFYHYHRSRMKVAKAGVSEAFGRLDEKIRVGYNNLGNTGGIKYPIPINREDGQFKGINRTQFYNYVQNEKDPSGTPTRQALNRAGLYFATDQPYRTRPNSPPLSCRRNYALLVTDGDWNGHDRERIYIGGGGVASTYCSHLACIAKHYWQTDLRPNLPDEVPVNGADSANWQHMNTFSISIGMKGSLDTSQPPPAGPTERNKSLSTKWPRPTNALTKTDDLWHAAVEGRGEFIVASDTDQFANALTSALTAINNRQASSSVISTSSSQIRSDTLVFSASFKAGTWSGDLVAQKIQGAGTNLAGKPEWVLSETFKPGGVNEHFKDRTISQRVIYRKGRRQPLIETISFDYSYIKNHNVDGHLALYERQSGPDAVSAEDNIAWLRGDQSKERDNGGNLRNRAHPIGDIVHSSVVYLKNESPYGGSDMVFAGANDGMLHAIRANDGKVMYSYIPHGVDISEFAKLSSPGYEHRFFVDGDIDTDTHYRRAPSERHMLVASLGRGGRGVFMLNGITTSGGQNADNIPVVFDHTYLPSDTTTDPNMGYVLGAIRLRRDNRARTWAIVPNGIDSPNGKAVLFAYNVEASNNIKRYELIADEANTSKGNGLMAVSIADIDGDGYFDVIYGGDLKGNIWRWDFTGEEPGQAVKIFQAKDAKGNPQPITGGISYARERGLNGRHFIGFGTGRYISVSDMPQAGVKTQVQSLYGIIDQTSYALDAPSPLINGRSELQERKIAYVGSDIRAFDKYEALPENKKGWYIDLPEQERVISQPIFYDEALYFVSVIPPLAGSDECGNGTGSSYVNAINLFTGTGAENISYFSGYASILVGGDELPVGSIQLDGMRAGLALLKEDNGGNFEGIEVLIGSPTDPNDADRFGGINKNAYTQIQRIQWRSLL